VTGGRRCEDLLEQLALVLGVLEEVGLPHEATSPAPPALPETPAGAGRAKLP
jgi:hypothetical protein